MKNRILSLVLMVVSISTAHAQSKSTDFGRFSLGTRNTISLFNDESGTGTGIGGQFRFQLSSRLNTEWYLDYISSRGPAGASRRDHHIGWSVLYYPGKISRNQFLKPYLIGGHCFDRSELAWSENRHEPAITYSMATQAGAGCHLRITDGLDCSLSAQYMLHFGKHVHAELEEGEVHVERDVFGRSLGHLLMTVSFNYVIGSL